MKEYLDGFMKEARRIADVLAVKTSETVDAAKLEIELRKLQKELDKEYKALGQIMFQVEKGALKKEEAIIKTACKRIQERIDAIIEIQHQKENVKAEKEVKEETVEEPVAPEETVDAEEDEEEVLMPERGEEGYFVLKFCPKCNVGNHPDAVRCVKCGTEFAKQEETE